MYAPRVFVSMIGALAAFAIATYFLTHSLSTTLIDVVICAVLLQVGYFAGVLYLAAKAARERRSSLNEASAGASGASIRKDDTSVGLPSASMKRSGPLNR